MNIKAILFDLDNTLMDRDAAWRNYWTHFLRRHPEPFPLDITDTLETIIAEDNHGWRERSDFFGWLVRTFPHLQKSPDELWQHCRMEMANAIDSYPGAAGMMESLTENFVLGLVTNGSSEAQRRKLERSGLASYFEDVQISGDLGFEKPDARIFNAALRAIGCHAGDALFVGDDPVRDVFGAHHAGLRTCWISHGRTPPASMPRPDWVIGTVSELPAILETPANPAVSC